MTDDMVSSSERRRLAHEEAKRLRHERLSRGVYGRIETPDIPRVFGFWQDPPGYKESVIAIKIAKWNGRELGKPLRCFYTGCIAEPMDPRNPITNFDPRLVPWLGTRDHVVPLRRDLPEDLRTRRQPDALVWSCFVANSTMGLAPMLIRLKMREWLSAVPFARDDLSVEAGLNLRWIIIRMIEEFRIDGRLPWSRKPDGSFWNPGISIPFMRRMMEAEEHFLSLNLEERDAYVRGFTWQF